VPQDRRDLNEKLDRDLHAAANGAAKVVKFAVKVATTPKGDLLKKFFRMVVDGED